MSLGSILLLGCALIALLACTPPSDQGQNRPPDQHAPDWIRVIGRIDAGQPSSQTALLAPDTATAGVPFLVIVSTYGSTGCIRPDKPEVQRAQSSADITVYDSLWVGEPPC